MILRLFEESYRAFGTIDRPILEHWLCVQGHGLLGQGFEILRPRFQNFDVKALKSVKFSWKQWWVSFWPVLGARSEYFIRNLWKIFKFPDFFFLGGGGGRRISKPCTGPHLPALSRLRAVFFDNLFDLISLFLKTIQSGDCFHGRFENKFGEFQDNSIFFVNQYFGWISRGFWRALLV